MSETFFPTGHYHSPELTPIQHQTIHDIRQVIDEFKLDHQAEILELKSGNSKLTEFFASIMGGIEIHALKNITNQFHITFLPRQQDQKTGRYKFNSSDIIHLDLFVEADGTMNFPTDQAEKADFFIKSYPTIYMELGKISERASQEADAYHSPGSLI
jgi:hypothetical protein